MERKLLIFIFTAIFFNSIEAQVCNNYRSPFRASYENPYEYSRYGYDVYTPNYVESFAYTYASIPYTEIYPYAPGSYYYAFR